jgi:ribA/ribD-fused uncharacterized protein
MKNTYLDILKKSPPKTPEKYFPMEDKSLQKYLLRKKTFDRSKCIVIERNADEFGGMLNMHCGYPMEVNGVFFKSVEHLYQICRCPKNQDLQKRITENPSPLVAKWITKPHRSEGRKDWYQQKINFMRWCLHVKLACNYDTFGKLLDSTGNKTIVETSPDGNFWGGVPEDKTKKKSPLVGYNVFGQLLMELRDEYRHNPKSRMVVVQPQKVNNFRLFGKKIGIVDCR